jgi:hypothetical protein
MDDEVNQNNNCRFSIPYAVANDAHLAQSDEGKFYLSLYSSFRIQFEDH